MIDWICDRVPEAELPRWCETLLGWCAVNSGTKNLPGLARMHGVLWDAFEGLGDRRETLEVPPVETWDELGNPVMEELGRALRVRCRPEAPLQVLLSGHMDTVYGADHPFQRGELGEGGTILRGPGAADMKGGLLVMREALEVFESWPGKEALGWEVLITADEETGTPGSRELLREAAERNDFGLVFECSTLEGTMVHRRLGTGAFMAVAHGRPAHAGRDLAAGRNAIEALAAFVMELRQIHRESEGVLVNTARFHATGPLNAVPDAAVAQFNIRAVSPEVFEGFEAKVHQTCMRIEREHEVRMEWRGALTRSPRIPGAGVAAMERAADGCRGDLGLGGSWCDSGGGTDGSLLLAMGLPNLDSMGVRGGGLHSDLERIAAISLVERIRLCALFLVRVASGEVDARTFSL